MTIKTQRGKNGHYRWAPAVAVILHAKAMEKCDLWRLMLQ